MVMWHMEACCSAALLAWRTAQIAMKLNIDTPVTVWETALPAIVLLVFFCPIWLDLCIPITATAMQFETHSGANYPFSEHLQRANWHSSDCFVVLAFLQ